MSWMNRVLRLALTGLVAAMLVGALIPTARAAPQDLLVTSRTTDRVLRYDGATGAFLGDFVPAGSGGLDIPAGITFGPDGNLYVGNGSLPDGTPATTNSVQRYDGASGAFIDTFTSGYPAGIGFITFGPDGNLYGALGAAKLATGAFIDVFATMPRAGGGGAVRFGPDGNLYVSPATPRVRAATMARTTTATARSTIPRTPSARPPGTRASSARARSAGSASSWRSCCRRSCGSTAGAARRCGARGDRALAVQVPGHARESVGVGFAPAGAAPEPPVN